MTFVNNKICVTLLIYILPRQMKDNKRHLTHVHANFRSCLTNARLSLLRPRFVHCCTTENDHFTSLVSLSIGIYLEKYEIFIFV